MRGAPLTAQSRHAGVPTFERLEPPMDSNRSRTGVLVGLAAGAGAFGVAAMMSAATAPTARADDFTDVINAVDADYSAGQTAFTTAFTDFSSNDLALGLAALINGSNDDALSAPDNLLIGTTELLTNESVTGSIPWSFGVPADFSSALNETESIISTGENYLTTEAPEALSLGDYGTAAYEYLIGLDYLTVAPLDELLLGAAVSF
jgi:hypothetical protein